MIIKQHYMNSSWTDYRDSLIVKGQDELLSRFQDEGIQVFIKTDLTPELKVFDSATLDKAVNENSSPLVNVGVRIIDKKGKELYNYGGFPETNPVKSLALYGGLAGLLYLAFKGLRG